MDLTIKSTTKYDIFDLHHINRDVYENTKDFKELVSSMMVVGFLPECHINCVKNGGGKLKIKQGHNRFRAAQAANVPVFYMVAKDIASIHHLESGPGKWKPKDYLSSYVKDGVVAYQTIKTYMERTGISLNCTASMFYGQGAGSSNWSKDGTFKSGDFKIKNFIHPNIIADLVLFLKTIGINWAAETPVVSALSKMVFLNIFDSDRFKSKAKAHKHIIEKQRTVSGYLNHIEEIYNYHVKAKSKENLAFLAQQASDGRMNKILNK